MKIKTKKILCYSLIGIAVLILAYSLLMTINKKESKKGKNEANNNVPVISEKDIKIIDLNSKTRPYAIMVNNISAARPYQSGLQDAYIVYEIVVEGGITRFLALFKDQTTTRIGSVRSSRHYYLDYAIENDAIYVHFGWSPQAQSDIATLKINNVNGLYDDTAFWRDKDINVDYEHTAYTSIEKISDVVKLKKYRTTTDTKTLLNYSEEEVDLSGNTDALESKNLSIKYSNFTITSYKYNEEEKKYYRSVNGEPHIDYVTKSQYTAKNIIIAYMSNDDMNDDKGRQNLNNIGSGNGYYITNGYAVPITWNKSTRKSQTIYKLKTGEEINVNDGNTYIQIAPLGSITIS